MKTIFFGTPEFAAYSLEAILDAGFDVAAVVTMPDKIAGRGHKLFQSPVKKLAVERSLPLLQPRSLKDPEFLADLKAFNADLFVVIAFRMLPEAVWAMPEMGTFNLHASLLPRYRGAAPINRAIINGETKTGVTTFFLRHDIDTGDIISSAEIDILPQDNVGSLHDKLMELGATTVVDTMKRIENGTATSHPQPDGEFIPAPKIFREDCRINWNQPAIQVHNLIRGLSPYPAAFTTLRDEKKGDMEVKIFASTLIAKQNGYSLLPGEVYTDKTHLYIGTADAPLEILTLQPQGKRPMSADAFLRGYNPHQAL